MVKPTLQEMSLKEAHESFSSSSRGPIHEDRRLQIEELDDWRTNKWRTHDKPKLHQNGLSTFPNQLKIGDKVLLDAADPHIVTTKSNEEMPLMVLSIFPFDTVEVSHHKFGTFKVNNTRMKPYFDENDSRNEEYKLLESLRPFNGEYLTPNLLTEILNTGFSTQTRPSTQACLGTCENRAKISPIRAMINRHGRATWPWANLSNQHRRSTLPCQATVVKPVKLTRA
ncbi:hypothetical protein GOBAR_AA35951 [Gossypium barbadense]|uniref:Uncharacterized protein n=1 Tax=Gossypium barbadense TaxID=3634 RepID=A0A2P5W111_GOSBA|nr:hypothetical protein GOBAR_AA35951 [Gossypium barbadense]